MGWEQYHFSHIVLWHQIRGWHVTNESYLLLM